MQLFLKKMKILVVKTIKLKKQKPGQIGENDLPVTGSLMTTGNLAFKF